MITNLICFRETKHVDELESGSRGLCPYCRTAKMTVKASKHGIKFASLMPGQKHSKDDCIKQEKKIVNYDPRKSNPEELFSSILHRPKIEKTDDEGNEEIASETDESSAEEELHQKPAQKRRKPIRQDRKIKSLKNIWQDNIRSLGYEVLYGSKKLGEVVTFPEFAGRFFADNTGEGQHIFFCRFLGCVDRSFALIFRIFWKDGDRLLVLRCEKQDEELYDTFCSQFQEYYEDEITHGLSWRKKQKQPDLLILGDFELVQFPHCREYCFMACNECHTKEMLVSYLRNKQQIYACVGSGRKKE